MGYFIDPTAAAYGLFQVVFASLDTRLTRSLVDLCRCREPEFAFQLIKELSFGRRLQLFENALERLARDLSVPGEPPPEEVDYLRTARATAKRVAAWRNARIHAEVRQVNGFNAFYDRRGQRLCIETADCDRMRDEATIAENTMAEHLPGLVSDINLSAKISEALADVADPGAHE